VHETILRASGLPVD